MQNRIGIDNSNHNHRQVLELCVENKVPVRALARNPDAIKRLPFYKPELVEVLKGDVCSYSSLSKAVGRCKRTPAVRGEAKQAAGI
eukprot:1155227-Pelagomonas_calceolata.AAC.3